MTGHYQPAVDDIVTVDGRRGTYRVVRIRGSYAGLEYADDRPHNDGHEETGADVSIHVDQLSRYA